MSDFFKRHKVLTAIIILFIVGLIANACDDPRASVGSTASTPTPKSASETRITAAPTSTPYKPAKLSMYEESEPLKKFMFGIKSWDKLSRDSVEKTCKELGLKYSDQMGWGGTSWSCTVEDPYNKFNKLTITFGRPKEENGKEYFSFFYLYVTRNYVSGKNDGSLHYYSARHAKAIHDIKSGFFIDDVEYPNLQTGYDALVKLVSE